MVNSSFLEKKSKGSYFGGFVTGDAWKENRRTDSEIRVLAKEVAQGKMTAKETGITGESALLSCNPHFDAVYSFLPEPFHAIYEASPVEPPAAVSVFQRLLFLALEHPEVDLEQRNSSKAEERGGGVIFP